MKSPQGQLGEGTQPNLFSSIPPPALQVQKEDRGGGVHGRHEGSAAGVFRAPLHMSFPAPFPSPFFNPGGWQPAHHQSRGAAFGSPPQVNQNETMIEFEAQWLGNALLPRTSLCPFHPLD